MALFDRLRNSRDFTDTDRAIAEYVIANTETVADMNIGELAKATHTSNAAVTRFCHKLGLEGYRAFRLELARELERAQFHVYNVNPDLPFMENATTRDVMESMLNLSRQALEDTHRLLNPADVSEAARLICGARRVALYGYGDSWASAEGFANLLMKVDIACIPGIYNLDHLVVGNILNASDVAVVITYSGIAFSQLETPIKGMRDRGCRVIALTSYDAVDEHIPNVECVLKLPKGETRKGRVSTYYSQTCIRYALNCIYGEIFTRNWQRSKSINDRYAAGDQEMV